MSAAMVHDLLGATDYLIANEHEALDAAAAIGTKTAGFEDAAAALAKAGMLTCVVTAGAQGAFAFAPDAARIHAPSMKITPVDTTGAGDTFVGAFACILGEKAALQKALQVGCEAAALKCLKAGAQDGMPAREALRALDG
jgi:ribokinase